MFLGRAASEEASGNPSGQVFDLQEEIDDRFPPAVHGAGYIVEARDGDVLTQRELWELYRNTERLHEADAVGELAPPGLQSQPYLYHYYSAGFERNIVGIYSLADAVQEVLTADFNTTLERASDDQVKVALHRLFSEPRGSEFVEVLSVKATKERRRVLGEEIDYWSSPALFTSVVADNDKLGGGSVSIGASSDDTTKQKERFNRNVQRTLRGDQESYRLWGIVIDAGLEIENEAGLTGPFIAFTVIAVLVVVGLALRSYWAVAVTGAGMGILMIWLKGISNLIGLKSGLTIDLIVPIAMVSLGVDFAIHALRRYGEEKDKGYPPRRAFTVGTAGVLGALALAFVTTGVAFLANVSSEIEAVIHFGIAASIAVMAAFVVLGVVSPLVVMRIDGLIMGAAQDREAVHGTLRRRLASLGRLNAIGLAAGITGMAVIFLVAPVTGLEVGEISLDPVIGMGLIAGFVGLGVLLPVAVMAGIGRRSPSTRVSVLPQVAGGSGDAETEPSRSAVARGLTSVVVGLAQRRGWVLLATAAVTAVFVFYALKLEATFDVRDFFDNSSDFVVSLDKVDEHVADTGGESGIVYIRGNLADPQSVASIQQLLLAMKDNGYLAKERDGELETGGPTVLTYLALLTTNEYARAQVGQVTGVEIVDTDGDGFPDTETQIRAAYDYMVEHGVPLDATTVMYEAGRVRQLLYHDPSGVEEDVTVVSVEVPGTREQSTVTAARGALEEDLQVLDRAPSITFSGVTGSPFTREASLDATSRALNVALPIAAVLCFLVVLVVMRSPRYALVTIVPIGLVVAWLYAFMYLAGFALNFVTAITAAVSIGIGVDYAIHFTQRFREELARAGEKMQAVRLATQGTGVALVASAASSMVGFIILSFAPMPVFASYGVLTAVMIGLAAIASLVVLPSLLVMVAQVPTPSATLAAEESTGR